MSAVLSEMKICQFMCLHSGASPPPPPNGTAYCRSCSSDIYQLCFRTDGVSPPARPVPTRPKWSISTTWTDFTNRRSPRLCINESLLIFWFIFYSSRAVRSCCQRKCVVADGRGAVRRFAFLFICWFVPALLHGFRQWKCRLPGCGAV
jgi:hypothetical protein